MPPVNRFDRRGVHGQRTVLGVGVVHRGDGGAAGVPDRGGVADWHRSQRAALAGPVGRRAGAPVGEDAGPGRGSPAHPGEQRLVSLFGRGSVGGDRPGRHVRFSGHPVGRHVLRRRRRRQFLQGGLRVLVHPAGGGRQHGERHGILFQRAGFRVLREVLTGDQGLVESVEPRLSDRVHGGDEHRDDPARSPPGIVGRARSRAIPVGRGPADVGLAGLRLRPERVRARGLLYPRRAHLRALPTGSHLEGAVRGVIHPNPVRSHVDVGRRLGGPARSRVTDPGGPDPVQLAAWPGEVRGGDGRVEVGHHQGVADECHRRRDLDAGNLRDLAVLLERDATADA